MSFYIARREKNHVNVSFSQKEITAGKIVVIAKDPSDVIWKVNNTVTQAIIMRKRRRKDESNNN